MSQARAIAFFPWWINEEPISIGPIRLRPYAKGRLPGNLDQVEQADIDGVMQAYANRPGHRVKKATLLEVDDWHSGADPEGSLTRLFLAKEALGFAGLASRKLFKGHFGYCCFDNFIMVVQRFRPGKAGTFAYTIRRRDGSSTNLWSSDQFTFQRPLHVSDPLGCVPLDEALVCMLMAPEIPAHWLEAIREFNRANTDSADIPVHVELVMMKSAFEQLLDIDEKARSFADALDQILPPVQTSSSPPPGPLRQRWLSRFDRFTRPIHSWAKEFCIRRGAAAHGNDGGSHHVWSDHAHLAFASFLFPLLLKKRLF